MVTFALRQKKPWTDAKPRALLVQVRGRSRRGEIQAAGGQPSVKPRLEKVYPHNAVRAKAACIAYPVSCLRDNWEQTVFFFCLESEKQVGHMRHGFFIAAWQVTVPEKNKKPGAGNCTGNQDREAAASGCKKAFCGTRSGPCGVRLGFGTCLSYPGCSGHPSQGDGWGQGERRASGDQVVTKVAVG